MYMETLLSITDVSKMTGISTKKLRYWDRCGKLKPIKKGESGHRYYSQEQVITAMKLTTKQAIIAYTVLNNMICKDVYAENKDNLKIAAMKNKKLIKRIEKYEPEAKIAGICDIWHGENKNLGIEAIIRMAVNKQVSKVYYDGKDQFIVGDWDNYKYWFSFMDTELIDINDIEKKE